MIETPPRPLHAGSNGRRIDVVIPTRDTKDLTVRCVKALFAAHLRHEASVHCTVVDNGSTDGTAEAISARWPAATVLRNDDNVGYGHACNQGAAGGSAPYVLILNSDAIARRGAVARLVDFLESHEECVLAGGCLVDPGTDRTQVGFTIRGYPTLANQIALMVGLERYWPRNAVSRRQLMLDFDFNRTQLVDAQPAGACLVCRRAAFVAEGGFDEAFHYWFEDVDLVRRMARRGRIAYVHDAVFDHVGAGTFKQWSRAEVVRTRYASLIRYFDKHHSGMSALCLRGTVAALSAVRAVFFSILDRPQAEAYGDVLRVALQRRHPTARNWNGLAG